jgi:hypothetical protein
MVQIDHNHRLDKIAVDRIAHPSATSFNFNSALPVGVKPVNHIDEKVDRVAQGIPGALIL